MRILLIHADRFLYEVRDKAIERPEEFSEDRRKGSMEDVLVVFSTVEKSDELDPKGIAEKASEDVEEVAKMVKTKNVVVYPYAHLSSELASPTAAMQVLSAMDDELSRRGLTVKRSPFGWYKSFEIFCKGHPLSELSRSVTLESRRKEEGPAKREKGEYIIAGVDGVEQALDLKRVEEAEVFKGEPLMRKFIMNEEVGSIAKEEPTHIRSMRKLELVDYEPASDIGHFRYYPKGVLIKRLLEDFATEMASRDLGCMRIETPSMYRLDMEDIAGQAARFAEKDYRFVADGRRLTMRFAGDFGLFRMMKDAIASYRQLPIRIYELSPSYRLEKSGECMGLKRLRAFTMPDVHCFCKDLEQALGEYELLLRYYSKLVEAMGIDHVLVFRAVKDFYLSHRSWFAKLVKSVNKPALIELLSERKHYWLVKQEYQFMDAVGGNAQLCTIQLDVEDSERYGLYYTDADGSRKPYTIIHSSMGSIERWIYALLEQAETMKRKGSAPMLPLWLSPTQVRILPVSKDQLDYANSVANGLEGGRIRVDVDDREISLAKKIREGEMEWVPYLVVVGKDEQEGGTLTVRRRTKEVEKRSLDELRKEINALISAKPRASLPLSRLLSGRPKFSG